jgi:hypothetical protein
VVVLAGWPRLIKGLDGERLASGVGTPTDDELPVADCAAANAATVAVTEVLDPDADSVPGGLLGTGGGGRTPAAGWKSECVSE